jgi:hypothetical protein
VIKVEVACSSNLYFPHWIYKRLGLNQDLGLRCIKNQIDEEMIRKMTVVSFWCIQTYPSNWPAIHKVVEMLKGSLQVPEIPPKPCLYSPSTYSTHLSSEILWFVWILRCNAEYAALEKWFFFLIFKMGVALVKIH